MVREPWVAEVLHLADDIGVLKVRILGAGPAERRRLAQILSAAPGIELAGGEPASALVGSGPALSRRQRDVLVAYASGNQLLPVVARRLGMDVETLKTHLRRVRAKYRSAGRPAPTRRDLYVRAVEDGLLPPPS